MSMAKAIPTAAAVTAALVSGSTPAGSKSHKGYEMPPFKVIAQNGPIERRVYDEHIVIETTEAGTRASAANRAFRTLAGYIFGGNATGEQIAMTAPVSQTQVADGWRVRFVVPASYDLSELPKPKTGALRATQLPASEQLVIRFTGRWTQTRLREQEKVLRSHAEKSGTTLLAGPFYYFYDDPMTAPWNRRNEIAFTVEGN